MLFGVLKIKIVSIGAKIVFIYLCEIVGISKMMFSKRKLHFYPFHVGEKTKNTKWGKAKRTIKHLFLRLSSKNE